MNQRKSSLMANFIIAMTGFGIAIFANVLPEVTWVDVFRNNIFNMLAVSLIIIAMFFEHATSTEWTKDYLRGITALGVLVTAISYVVIMATMGTLYYFASDFQTYPAIRQSRFLDSAVFMFRSATWGVLLIAATNLVVLIREKFYGD